MATATARPQPQPRRQARTSTLLHPQRRRASGAGARRSAVAPAASALGLALCLFGRPCSAAEGWDIAATVYSDQFCFERVQDLLLLDGTCYSTMHWSNTSSAFRVRVVNHGNRGSDWVVDYQEFSDDCHTPVMASSNLVVGNCVSFLGRYRGTLSVKLRSDRCDGDSCSNLAVAEQNFYDLADCEGDPIVPLRRWVPLQGECLIMRNQSSQKYIVMPDQNETRIARTDYPGDDKCNALFPVDYDVIGKCYPLYGEKAPRSFSWTAHRKMVSVSAARGRSELARLLWILVLALGVATLFASPSLAPGAALPRSLL